MHMLYMHPGRGWIQRDGSVWHIPLRTIYLSMTTATTAPSDLPSQDRLRHVLRHRHDAHRVRGRRALDRPRDGYSAVVVAAPNPHTPATSSSLQVGVHWVGCINFMVTREFGYPETSWVISARLVEVDPTGESDSGLAWSAPMADIYMACIYRGLLQARRRIIIRRRRDEEGEEKNEWSESDRSETATYSFGGKCRRMERFATNACVYPASIQKWLQGVTMMSPCMCPGALGPAVTS